MTAISLTQDEVLKKLITRASDSLVLDVYARMREDRRLRGSERIRTGAAKSWTELVNEALREGALTVEEAALVLLQIRS